MLERKLSKVEKQEILDVFYRLGNQMGLSGLPKSFEEWKKVREEHLNQNLLYSHFTKDLFAQYRKHLDWGRYRLLLETQSLIAPKKVRDLLGFRKTSFLKPLIGLYKLSRSLKMDWFLKALILPKNYKNEIRILDIPPI